MCGPYFGDVWGLLGECLGYVSWMLGACLEDAWEHDWGMVRAYLDNTRAMFG